MQSYKGKQVVIIGAARQGLALSSYLAKHGAKVILTDARPAEQLKALEPDLTAQGIQFHWCDHPDSLLEGTDLVCPSGGVPLNIPFVQQAIHRRIKLSNDSQIFLEICPCTVIGITGSAGKTTTTALVGQIVRDYFELKSYPYQAWVGGNIGNPLISHVDEMEPDDLAVMELSSFQLELMTRSPQIAAVLNLTPNHLDRHGNFEAYAFAKSQILLHQSQGDVAILNRDDEGSFALADKVVSDMISFGLKQPGRNQNGTYVEKEHIWLQIGRDQLKMLPTEWIPLRGTHNLYNVLAACAISAAASLALPAIQKAIEEFKGVPHRLEFVREVNGVSWYNDSIATAPERTLAAIEAFEEPLVLLLGGRDKNLPWEKLARVLHRRVKHVVLFGEAGPMIESVIGVPGQEDSLQSVSRTATLEEAVALAAQYAQAGDVVLLSPGGTSYDAFIDFEARGESYRKWVNELT